MGIDWIGQHFCSGVGCSSRVIRSSRHSSCEMGVLITPRPYSQPYFLMGEPVPSLNRSLCNRSVVLLVVGQGNDRESTDSAIYVPVPIPHILSPVPYQPHDVLWQLDAGGPAWSSTHGSSNCLAVITSLLHANTRATLRKSSNR